MTEAITCPPALIPEEELKRYLIRISYEPEGVVVRYEDGKEEQALKFLESGLIAESKRVERVSVLELFNEFYPTRHLKGGFFAERAERSDWQENTAFLFFGADNLTDRQYLSLRELLDEFTRGTESIEGKFLHNHQVYPIVLLSNQSLIKLPHGHYRSPTICDLTGL